MTGVSPKTSSMGMCPTCLDDNVGRLWRVFVSPSCGPCWADQLEVHA